MSEAFYKRLPADLQKIVMDGAKKFRDASRANQQKDGDRLLKEMVAKKRAQSLLSDGRRNEAVPRRGTGCLQDNGAGPWQRADRCGSRGGQEIVL